MGDTGCLPSSTLFLTPSLSGKSRALVTTGEERKQGDLSHPCGASGGGKASRSGRFPSRKVSRRGLGEGGRIQGVSGEVCGQRGKLWGRWDESGVRTGTLEGWRGTWAGHRQGADVSGSVWVPLGRALRGSGSTRE